MSELGNDVWYVLLVSGGMLALASLCRCTRRQRRAAAPPSATSSEPHPLVLPPTSFHSLPALPASGYAELCINGQLLLVPRYSYAPPSYRPTPSPTQSQSQGAAFPPGVAAASVSVSYPTAAFPAAMSVAETAEMAAALSVDRYAGLPSFRLSDAEGAAPLPAHLRPMSHSAAPGELVVHIRTAGGGSGVC